MATGNSGDTVVSQVAFYGGKGTDRKIGIKNSFADAECLDARKSPSQLSVLPGARKIIDTDLTSLITAIEQTPDGVRWGVGHDGKLYKISTTNDISVAGTLPNWTNGTLGDIKYWKLTDSLYITGYDRIYAFTPVLGAGTPDVKTITAQASNYPTVAQILVKDRDSKWIGGGVSRWSFKTGGAGSYSLPTSLSEADANKCIFLPDQSPLIKIDVKFLAKGTGSVTLVIHDANNKQIASSTLTAAQITTGVTSSFTFDQIALGEYQNFGTEYHMHLYSTTSGFTVESYESGQLYGLHYYIYASLLYRTTRKSHPIANWAGSRLIIGNGQYAADWLPSGLDAVNEDEFKRHRIIVETGMEISSITSNDEYTVFGCEKVSTVPGRIFQEGMLGFWDGFADALNYKIDTPMGEPKSLYTYQNITYTIIDGAIYAYTGGKQLTKVRTLEDSQSEYTNSRDTTDIYPNCMTVRRGILLMIYPSITTLTTMRHGVYSWGSIDKNYPNSFYFSYDIPEAVGHFNTSQYEYELGGVWNFGETLYFSYRITDKQANTTTYNLAVVDNDSLPASKFKYESLVYDGGVPWTNKQALRMGMSFSPLPDGIVLTPKYRIDGKEWVLSNNPATKDETYVTFEINKRFNEIEFGFDGTNDGVNNKTPRITSVVLNVRSLSEESKV